VDWFETLVAVVLCIVVALLVFIAVTPGTKFCPDGKTLTPIAGGKAGLMCL
jgi:hypothetical protein